MTSFDERKQAFETKFRVDEELRFKTHAKAMRLFGLWTAKQLGLQGLGPPHGQPVSLNPASLRTWTQGEGGPHVSAPRTRLLPCLQAPLPMPVLASVTQR